MTPLHRTALAVILSSLLVISSCGAGRAPFEEVEQIVAALHLEPGMAVADVGAGDGEWTEALSRRVGPEGRVFATEVDEDDVQTLARRFSEAGIDNVRTVLGDQLEMGLPPDCCDAILLRLVYHHFTDPRRMREELRRALRSGGLLAVIEITIQPGWGEIDGVPDRGGHGIDPQDLLDEMLGDGWSMVERHDDWGNEADHFCVVFRAGTPSGQP